MERIRDAFIYLESAAAKEKFVLWPGHLERFRLDAAARESLQLGENGATGARHCRRGTSLPLVQLRSLAMTEALTLGNQTIAGEAKTVMEAAKRAWCQSDRERFLLQGQVARNLPPFVAQALDCDLTRSARWQFVRFFARYYTALVGMSHQNTNNQCASGGMPPATVDEFSKLFSGEKLPKCERQRAEICARLGRSMLRPYMEAVPLHLGELQLLVAISGWRCVSRRESRPST